MNQADIRKVVKTCFKKAVNQIPDYASDQETRLIYLGLIAKLSSDIYQWEVSDVNG